MAEKSARSSLATEDQRDGERLALRLIETPEIRAARESARTRLVDDPVYRTPDGYLGLDRALDQWVLALAMRVVNADPWRPRILWNIFNPPRNWFGHTYPGAAVAIDNPDNANREIAIDGDSSYEIRGQFGPSGVQFMIEIVTDFDGYAGVGRTLSALTTQTIKADADGRFTVTVDAQPANGRPNHIQSIAGRLQWVFSRDSTADWRKLPSTLQVERIAGPPSPPPRSDDEIIQDIVQSMPVWVAYWAGFKDTFLDHPAPNKLVGPIGRPGGWGYLAGGRFKIDDETAVIVTTSSGGSNYTGFQISDPWTVSPDPVYRLASLNKTQARPNADGTYTYVLSARDPGIHNWIDTLGMREGWMLLRWQGVPAETDPAGFIRSVSTARLSELAQALPSDVPTIDLQGRRDQIAARIAEFDLRFAE